MSYVTKVSGKDFIYHKSTDVLQLVLSSPGAADQFDFEWNYNNSTIEHVNNTDG